MNIIQSPSPNFGSRNGYKPEMIVIHCTDGKFPYDMEYLQDPNPQSVVGPVSAHFVVAPNGDVHQLVDTISAAWHAGRVNNPTATLKKDTSGAYINPNQYSIGIETSMPSTSQISALQQASLTQLVAELGTEFAIPLDRSHVVGHHEIYSLKTCPGTIDVSSLLPQTTAQFVASELPKIQQMANQIPSMPLASQTKARLTLQSILTLLSNLLKGF